MQLVEETKTFQIPLEDMFGSNLDKVADVVRLTMNSMPEWGLVSYTYKEDEMNLYMTVRRRP